MSEAWHAARVGLMVLLGLAAIYAVYRYVDERAGGQEGYSVYARFEDVQGLIPKSRVLVAGIPVGFIESIGLEGQRARVDIQIDGDVALYEDARVAMRSVSLLGEKMLAINPGTTGKPRLSDGDEIVVASEGVSTDDVLATVSEIAESVKKVTQQMERAFGTDEAGARMENALLQLSEALEAINRTVRTNEESIGEIFDNVELATRDLSEIIHTHRDDIGRGVGEVDETISAIRRAAERLDKVLIDVNEVTGRTARGEGTIGRLTQDEALIDEIENVAEGIGDVVGGIARLRTIVELRSEFNFYAQTFKTYFTLQLQPREGRYFLLQVVDDPRGKETFSETFVRRSPPIPGEPGTYQETRITRTDALRFSVMLAKRISFATFRFGIMESTGGLGMDLHLFRDRLEINTDVFAIGNQTFPRWRTRASYEVLSRFWILAGVDDVLNSENRDFFMGLMLRFDDEDLKGLLPFAGGVRP